MAVRRILLAGVITAMNGNLAFAQGGTISINFSLNVNELSGGASVSESVQEVTNEYYFVGVKWPENQGCVIVVEPPGSKVEIFRGRYRILEDWAPTAKYIPITDEYEIMLTMPDGRVWRRKFLLKAGMKYLIGAYPVAFSSGSVVVAPAPALPPAPVVTCPAMSTSEFNDLVEQLRDEAFEDTRIDILSTALKSKCITCAQAKQIASLFAFDDNRLKAMQICYPALVDKENVYQLYSVFQFDDTKEDFKQWIESQGH